jgi:hypothetical protein
VSQILDVRHKVADVAGEVSAIAAAVARALAWEPTPLYTSAFLSDLERAVDRLHTASRRMHEAIAEMRLVGSDLQEAVLPADQMAVLGRIRKVRQARNLTLEDVGQLVGMQGGGFGKIERGERALDVAMLLRVAGALKVSPEFLLLGDQSSEAGTVAVASGSDVKSGTAGR